VAGGGTAEAGLSQEELPTRQICFTPDLYGFVTYGLPVNGLVVRDEYAPTTKHPEGK